MVIWTGPADDVWQREDVVKDSTRSIHVPIVCDDRETTQGRVHICVKHSCEVCVPNGVQCDILLKDCTWWNRQILDEKLGLAICLVNLIAASIMRARLMRGTARRGDDHWAPLWTGCEIKLCCSPETEHYMRWWAGRQLASTKHQDSIQVLIRRSIESKTVVPSPPCPSNQCHNEQNDRSRSLATPSALLHSHCRPTN